MKKICPLPWLSLSTESQRELRLCCHETREVTSDSYLEDHKNKLSAFNQPLFTNARKEMLKGNLPKSCSDCAHLEEMTGHSPRLEYLERFEEHLPDLLEATDEEGKLSQAKLVYLDVTTDNQCNLKCRMCRPRYSQKILDDWKKIGWDPGENEVLNISLDKSTKTYQESPLIKESLQDLRMITLTGGEPFLSGAVQALLERVMREGNPQNISLRFFTNTTVLPKQLEAYLEQFKEVNIFCSIDAYGKTSDYIRYPSQWSTIEEVFHGLVSLMDKHSNLHIDLHTVVQAYNVTRLHELFEFLASFKGKIPLLPSFTHVGTSLPLKVNLIPKDLLIKAQEDFDKFLKEHADLIKSTHQGFHQREITNYRSILAEGIRTNSPDQFIDLVIYSKKLDKVRSQNFEDQYPELKLKKSP